MRFVKKVIFSILILITIGFLFRRWFYNQLVTYKSIGLRSNFSATSVDLITHIDAESNLPSNPEIEEIIKLGLLITSKKLNFTTGKNDIDPNKLVSSRSSHCVGYATFFATTCNYLLKKHNLAGDWTAKSQIGQLYLLGSNVHKHLSSPFLKDHDFVIIQHKATGEIFAVDPSLNDYLRIDFITYKE